MKVMKLNFTFLLLLIFLCFSSFAGNSFRSFSNASRYDSSIVFDDDTIQTHQKKVKSHKEKKEKRKKKKEKKEAPIVNEQISIDTIHFVHHIAELDSLLKIEQKNHEFTKAQLKIAMDDLQLLRSFADLYAQKKIPEMNLNLQHSFKGYPVEQVSKDIAFAERFAAAERFAVFKDTANQFLQSKKLYDGGLSLITKAFDLQKVQQCREALRSEMEREYLSETQRNELSSVRDTLLHYKWGITFFKRIINEVNQELTDCRDLGNSICCKAGIKLMFNEDERSKGVIKYIYPIPYLKKRYEDYRMDLENNPLINSEVEKEVLGYKED